MQSNFMFILVAIEVVLLCLAVCLFLVIKNRSLQRLIDLLKKRMLELIDDLKEANANKKAANNPETLKPTEDKQYIDWVGDQLDGTSHFHNELHSDQDIASDISPNSPLPNRTAALRNALLLAEKEAFAQSKTGLPDWRILQSHYKKIFRFYEKFAYDESDNGSQEEVHTLTEELTNARKRIKNLEKFKNLYFELEDKWQNSKDEAQMHFTSLTRMAEQLDDPKAFEQTLESYQAAYNQVSSLMESGIEPLAGSQQNLGSNNTVTNDEIDRLRQVAAEQHEVISGLKQKLRDSTTSEEIQNIVSALEVELQKQLRFVSESETCVQLMEDELQTAHNELELLRSKVTSLPQQRLQLLELRKERDEIEARANAQENENRKLRKKNKELDEKKDNAVETIKLRKALTSIESKYNDLEEKFLDLKLQKSG